SDDGLQEYLDNQTKFTPDAIDAAIAVMQKRGRVFTDEELADVRQDLQAKRVATEKEENDFIGNQRKKNVVRDVNAPAYYSERAISLLSAFFIVICAAVLVAMNCRSPDENKGV